MEISRRCNRRGVHKLPRVPAGRRTGQVSSVPPGRENMHGYSGDYIPG